MPELIQEGERKSQMDLSKELINEGVPGATKTISGHLKSFADKNVPVIKDGFTLGYLLRESVRENNSDKIYYKFVKAEKVIN